MMPHNDRFRPWPFQHTQASKEVAEEEQHDQIRPYTSPTDSPQQRVPKGHTRAKLSSNLTAASTVKLRHESKKWKNKWIDIPSSIGNWNPQSKLRWKKSSGGKHDKKINESTHIKRFNLFMGNAEMGALEGAYMEVKTIKTNQIFINLKQMKELEEKRRNERKTNSWWLWAKTKPINHGKSSI
jgi:hypothetical protein